MARPQEEHKVEGFPCQRFGKFLDLFEKLIGERHGWPSYRIFRFEDSGPVGLAIQLDARHRRTQSSPASVPERKP